VEESQVLFKSLVFSQASGSTGGLVYSRNAGGAYVRARVLPTNPQTGPQSAVRDALRTLVDAWTNVLTNAQRDAWNTYAFNTPTLNRVGDATHKSGQQMYIRSNVARLQASITRVDNAPTVFDLGSFTPLIGFTADASASTISIPFSNTDEWANDDDGHMLVYMGRPQNATRNFGKGPYQLLTRIDGASGTPPTTPVTPTSLFPMTAGQKIFLKINVCMPDGRYTNPQTISGLVVA